MPVIHRQFRKNPYVQIDKSCLEDKRLTWKARGILAYLLSKPADWIITTEDLVRHSEEDGRFAIRSAMKELVQYGYALLVPVRETDEEGRETGRMAGRYYVLKESPEDAWDTDIQKSVTLGDTPITEDAEVIESDEIHGTKTDITVFRTSGDPYYGSTAFQETVMISKNDVRSKNDEEVKIKNEIPKIHTTRTRVRKSQRLRTDYTLGFLRMWENYPSSRRVSKPECFRVWCEHTLEDRAQEICDKIQHLKQTTWLNIDPQYIPQTTTWFNQGRWEDDAVTVHDQQHLHARAAMGDLAYTNALHSMHAMAALERREQHGQQRPNGLLSGPENPGDRV